MLDFQPIVSLLNTAESSQSFTSGLEWFSSEVVKWWACELLCVNSDPTFGQESIIIWLQNPTKGGRSPFQGLGAYSSVEVLYLSGKETHSVIVLAFRNL